MIQVRGERVLSENRMKRERLSDQKKKQEVSESRETRKKVGRGHQYGLYGERTRKRTRKT